MPKDLLLTFNAGSSSLKIGIFQIEQGRATRIGKGIIDLRHRPIVLEVRVGAAAYEERLQAEKDEDLRAVVEEVFDRLSQHFDLNLLRGAGHRVVHGGDVFQGPVGIDSQVLTQIEALVPLAPLHQPQALRFVKALQHLRPDIAQSASFDTAFHAKGDPLARCLALPKALRDQGIKRYGFHGLSYRFISSSLKAHGLLADRTIVAHLGSGASLCALYQGESRDCSMGFSTLDGVPMATRPGWLDPGVLLYLMKERAMSAEALEDLLYHQSGLLGVSGMSADTRDLLESDEPSAQLAVDLFALRIAGEVARQAVTLGGLDALVFTAGIGEHQPEVRARVVKHLAWLGARLDVAANADNAVSIAASDSAIQLNVIETDEEQVIADETLSILSKADPDQSEGARLR